MFLAILIGRNLCNSEQNLDYYKLISTPTDDVLHAMNLITDTMQQPISNYQPEPESREYQACGFYIGNDAVKYRSAKITPTKIGQFVTLWKRENSGPIKPYDISDNIDLAIISVRKNERFGIFIFPKKVLNAHDILSGNGKNGKRGFRVYPPWDLTENSQARKTQQWQLEYFTSA